MAIKNTEETRATATEEHENKSSVLKELQQSNRKRAHTGPEPNSPLTPRRSRTMTVPTTSAIKEDGFSPDSNLRQLLNAPTRKTEPLFKTEPECSDEAFRDIKTEEAGKTPQKDAALPAEILDPTPVIAPTKDAAIRCLLDLPRMDQRQTTKTDEAASLITPMPRHDPSDSPMMTQLKLHLAYAFHKLARNAITTEAGTSS